MKNIIRLPEVISEKMMYYKNREIGGNNYVRSGYIKIKCGSTYIECAKRGYYK